MDVPTLVSEALGDEQVAAHVPLKGDDALYVTATRTLRYAEEGLLSDESIDEFPHDAERVSVSSGRRKATIGLDYGTGGYDEFTVPSGTLESALHPVLAGVLNANDVTGPGETVTRTFRFSELTVVVTSDRLVKHIGSAVWDLEFEEIPYETVTGLSVEEGNVSSQIVLNTPRRTQRIKAPNESFREVRETVEDALFTFYDVTSAAELAALAEGEGDEGATDEQAQAGDTDASEVSFDSGIDPIGSGSSGDGSAEGGAEADPEAATEAATAQAATGETGGDGSATASESLEEQGFTAATKTVEPAIDPEELHAELDDLEAAIERQQELLEEQRDWIDDLRAVIPDR